jgi:ATP-binding cassette subfamily B protein
VSVWRLSWRVMKHRWDVYIGATALFILFFTIPVGIGWVLGRAFDAIATGEPVGRWVAALVVLEVARMGSIHAAGLMFTRSWAHMQTFLRANLLAAQVASGGPEAGQPVGSAGEAVTHFRDDTEDVAIFLDGMIDVSAGLVFTIGAFWVLGATNLAAAVVLIAPLFVVGVATTLLDRRIKLYRAEDRLATGAVTALVGDTMAAATTVKVNHAIEPVMGRLRRLVDRRRITAVRDRVLIETLDAFSHGVADVGLALVFLVSAGALASGAFDVGGIALFASYLGWLSFLPRMVGRVLARRKQAGVAFERMQDLVAERDARNTVRDRSLPIGRRQQRERPPIVRPQRVPLERLDVVGLSAVYPSGAGVHDVSLTVGRGEFVVITGPVGSGKSTLLRAILGLAWQADVSGEVRWNDRRLDDRGAFLVPPNAAFLPQVPQLVSDSIGDASAEAIAAALGVVMLHEDIDEFADGADTVVGPRGLRLSGGQRQRLAAARAVVHRPELVVLDDLSSALDVETELRLWQSMAEAGLTVLAVSHRAVAFERADRVIDLAGVGSSRSTLHA